MLDLYTETFIGGFAGGFLAKSITRIGYGIYFTTSRVIGIDLGTNGGGALGGAMAGFIHGQLMPQLSPEDSVRTIADLDRIKDFDFSKEQIQRIELKKPGLFGSGHIIIRPIHGNPVKISLRHAVAYDRLVELTRVFSPDKSTG